MKEIDSVVSMFRDQEYSANSKFKKEYQTGPLEDWTVVGHALSYVITQEGDKIPDEVLVWIEGSIVGMTQERYDLQRTR